MVGRGVESGVGAGVRTVVGRGVRPGVRQDVGAGVWLRVGLWCDLVLVQVWDKTWCWAWCES